jgi:hypothetical protein
MGLPALTKVVEEVYKKQAISLPVGFFPDWNSMKQYNPVKSGKPRAPLISILTAHQELGSICLNAKQIF